MEENFVERFNELQETYMKNRDEESRYRASELGKELFKRKIPPDKIVGLYMESLKSLSYPKYGVEDLLLEIMMTYSVHFFEALELREQLLDAERLAAIGRIAATVSHELRNPLGVIKNSIYFLGLRLKNDTDEKIMRHLHLMEKEIEISNKIISDLLDFARGPAPPNLQVVDLNPIVEEALSRIEVPDDVETEIILQELPKIRADPDHIIRMLHNLMLNGVQAMPKGGTLRIETRMIDDYVEMIVSDTGIGISVENMRNLFKPMFTTKAKGTGLGLYITKRLVEDHGGTINVKSKMGEGSIFSLRIPIDRKEGYQ